MQHCVKKEDWIDLFRETGLDDAMMKRWHHLFESKHPEGHQSFLEWLGLPDAEINTIRTNSQ